VINNFVNYSAILNSTIFTTVLNHFFNCYSVWSFSVVAVLSHYSCYNAQSFLNCYSAQSFLIAIARGSAQSFYKMNILFCYSAHPFCKSAQSFSRCELADWKAAHGSIEEAREREAARSRGLRGWVARSRVHESARWCTVGRWLSRSVGWTI
jgi:hypothetical protein